MIWALIVILSNADGSLHERAEFYRTTEAECGELLRGYEPNKSSTVWVASCQPRPGRPHR